MLPSRNDTAGPREESGLHNDSLAPIPKAGRTWGWFGIFNIWANDIQSLFGYSLVASLFISYGVTGWTAFLALIVAGLVVMVLVDVSGKPGVDYGIPYPVLARASMGVAGARLPAVLRASVAVFWYGAQTYFASTALELLILTLSGTHGGETFLGLSAVGWTSFVLVWAIQIAIFSHGMDWVGTFLNVAGPFVYLVMIGLLIVLWQQSDGQLWSAAQTIFAPENPTFASEFNGFVAIVGTMVAYFAAVMLHEMTDILARLAVYPERMQRNLDSMRGLIYSQPAMLALVDAGMDRQAAYKLVQRHAHAALDGGPALFEALQSDPEVSARIDAKALRDLFDPRRQLAEVDEVFHRLGLITLVGAV